MAGFTEGQRLLGSDGKIYVVRGGVPMPEGGSTDVSNIVAPNPIRVAQQALERARQDSADARAGRDQQIQEDRNERETRAWNASHNPDGSEKPKPNDNDQTSASTRAAALAGYATAAQLDHVIADLESRFNAGPGSTTGLAGLRDFLPSTANAQFDQAGNAARGLVGQALGFTGGQLNTEVEASKAVGPYLPQASDRDDVIRDKIGRLKELRDTARNRSIAVLGGVPDANGHVTPVSPAGQDHDVTAATGMTRNVPDPAANKLIDAAVRSGQSIEQVNAGLSAMGLPTADAGQFAAARQHFQASVRAGKPYAGSYGDAMREVPTTAMERTAASGPATGFLGALNGVTGGWFDEGVGTAQSALTGQPLLEAIADADRAKRAGADAHPYWSLGGNLVGNVGGMMLGGAGAAKLGLTAALGKAAPLAGDVAFGALSGAGENNENRGLGALLGAGLGAAGRGVTAGGTRVLGSAVRGVDNASARFLSDRGVKLTGGSMLGGRWKTLEDKAASAVGVGDLIASRQAEAVGDMNRGVANEALGHIGVKLPDGIDTGAPLHSFAEGAWNKAYGDARAGMTFLEDPQYRADVFNLQHAADNGALTEESAKRLAGTTHDLVTRRIENGGMNGDVYKDVVSQLRQRASTTPDPELKGALKNLRQFVDQAAARHSAPDAVDAMKNADRGYAKWAVYRDASSMAGGDAGVASPAQLQSAVRRADGSAGRNRYNQGKALLQDWSDASVDALGTKVPNSGTADRLGVMALPVIGGGIGAGAGYASGETGEGGAVGTTTGLGAALAAAVLNTPAGRAALARTLIERGPMAQQAGKRITDSASKAGILGRALGVTTAPLLLQ